VHLPKFGVQEGYAKWAETYDDEENPLIRLEEQAVASVLADLRPTMVLDAACGTGRHAIRFATAGCTVLAIEKSPEMLAVARTKSSALGLSRIYFYEGDIARRLPVPVHSVDLAVCALALCHIRPLHETVSALCATIRPGGYLLITDLHPVAVSAGLVTLFSHRGVQHAIETVKHSRDDYLYAMETARARLVATRDLLLGEAFDRMPRGLPEGVANASWPDLPFCLVLLGRMPS
jgi:SAM-dependent methyltransferase